MHFSLISVRPGCERAAAHQFASSPYEDHQWLWRFLPAEPGAARDYIFRRMDGTAGPRFYVVSKRAPIVVDDAWQVQTREYAPKLTAGTRLQFDLRANPVIATKAGEKSKRHDVVMQQKKRLLTERGLLRWQEWKTEDKPQMQVLIADTCGKWLAAQAERNGFDVIPDTLVVEGYERHVVKRGAVKFSTVNFRGELVVTDPEAFSQILCTGLGHAKAFGCGLMLVKRSA